MTFKIVLEDGKMKGKTYRDIERDTHADKDLLRKRGREAEEEKIKGCPKLNLTSGIEIRN